MATSKFSYDYDDILKSFGTEKIENRYDTIEQYLRAYIDSCQIEQKVRISECLLGQAIIDYFADIYRLKEFHKIAKVNYIKIHAYTGYWLLKRKPIQIIAEEQNGEDLGLTFVNEDFVASYLVHFLNENLVVKIKEKNRDDYLEFYENLKYTFRYRLVTAQFIETMLEAYTAGRRFENSIED